MSTAPDWIDDLLEEVGLIHHAPASLLKGRGGIRNAEVALARKVCYWVLKHRGLTIAAIALLFNRTWATIVQGLRWMDRELRNPNPPAWAIDVYPLANIGFHDLLRWSIQDLGDQEQEDIRAYCLGALSGGKAMAGRQLSGLQYLAQHPRVRRAIAWAFKSALDKDPSWSILWQAKQLGYSYVE